MNIIFLDIDGVLNSQNYIIKTHPKVLELYSNNNYSNNDELKLKRLMLDIDIKKLDILKDICNNTDSNVVIISAWKNLGVFPYVKNKLIEYGIPIIGITNDKNGNRGEGIKNYIIENNINNFIVLDDEIFEDYDKEILNRLVKTSFYKNGLEEEHKVKAIKLLKYK